MASHSKYFHQAAQDVACSQLAHTGTCMDSIIENFTRTIPGCVKFVLPLALIPIIMKVKHLNKHVFNQSLKIFVDYFLGAWTISGLGLSFMCVFRHFLGCFYYPTVLGVPAGLGGFVASFVLADRAVYTYAHGLSTIVFEIFLNCGGYRVRDARLALTFAFMAVNGMLMHGLRRTENGHFFWITQPLKCKSVYEKFYEASPTMDRIAPVARSQIKGCDHEHNCDSYIMEGLRKYFTFGLGLEIARSLIFNGSMVMKNPLTIFSLFTTRLNWNLISFLVGYVGIYRFVHCMCNRNNIYLKEDVSTIGHYLASFISGVTFYLYPNYSLLSHASINTIEVYWNLYYEQVKSYIDWMPWDYIRMKCFVFPFVFGYALHVRAFQPWLAPSMLKKLMHLSTSFKDADIYTRYQSFLFGLEPQFCL